MKFVLTNALWVLKNTRLIDIIITGELAASFRKHTGTHTDTHTDTHTHTHTDTHTDRHTHLTAVYY